MTVERPATVWRMLRREPDGERAGRRARSTRTMPEAMSHSGNRSTSTSAAKTSAGGRPIRVVIVDLDRHQPAPPDRPARAGTTVRARGPRPASRSAGSAPGSRGVVGARRAARRSPRTRARRPATRQAGSARRLSAQSASGVPGRDDDGTGRSVLARRRTRPSRRAARRCAARASRSARTGRSATRSSSMDDGAGASPSAGVSGSAARTCPRSGSDGA